MGRRRGHKEDGISRSIRESTGGWGMQWATCHGLDSAKLQSQWSDYRLSNGRARQAEALASHLAEHGKGDVVAAGAEALDLGLAARLLGPNCKPQAQAGQRHQHTPITSGAWLTCLACRTCSIGRLKQGRSWDSPAIDLNPCGTCHEATNTTPSGLGAPASAHLAETMNPR